LRHYNKGYTAEPAIVDCCRKRNPRALKALLAHGADPNFIMPFPNFSLAYLLNSFRDRRLDKRTRQLQPHLGTPGVPPGQPVPPEDSDEEEEEGGGDQHRYGFGSLSDAVEAGAGHSSTFHLNLSQFYVTY
jgi:hypothetical protein